MTIISAGVALSADTAATNSRRSPFDNVTIFLHWATVIVVLAMFTSAWLRSQSQDDAFKSILLQVHRCLGVTIWVTTAFRIAWRLTNATLPPFPVAMTELHRAVVRWSEYGLYALILVQPVTGMGATLLSPTFPTGPLILEFCRNYPGRWVWITQLAGRRSGVLVLR
jgi:cytochrome b561